MRLLSFACQAPWSLVLAVGMAVSGLVGSLAIAWADGDSSETKGLTGILIRLDQAGKIQVLEIAPRQVEKEPPAIGLLIWTAGDDEEHWAIVSPGWKIPPPVEYVAGPPRQSADATRGGTSGGAGVEVTQLTLQLEQISPDTSTRIVGVYPLTPAANGRLLNSRPTFRRLPLVKEPRFPAAVAILTSDLLPKPLLITFAADKDRVRWEDLQGLPTVAKDGLPAGQYAFGPQKGLGGNFVTFLVEESKDRKQILQPVEALAALLKKRSDPLLLQFELEHLLRFRGENNTPLFLSDALDLLESVPEKELTPHLRRQRQNLIRCLEAEPGRRGEALIPAVPPGDGTGIPELETAREWIASNRWREALAALDNTGLKKKMMAETRTAGLAQMYRGVVLAESGPAQEREAQNAFETALTKLKTASPSDRFRAHVNYANFLQRSANDHVHNHALQMAAGVPQPFLSTMRAWLAAQSNYEAALQLADQLQAPAQKAAVQVNLARLYALLADVIRTLDSERRAFAAGERAAADAANELARSAPHAADAEIRVRAIAEEVRAQLAFRSRRDVEAEAAARRALTLYLDAGHLAGAENVYRVLGLIAERRGDKVARTEALRFFQVAQRISESVRERFPPGNAGLTRAGFFARKAYVSEKIVELLLAEERPVEALRSLELAKARSLQDLLAARNLSADKRVPDLGQVLAKWPSDVAAVEYFLGAKQAHVFVVAPGGQVTAHLLRDKEGNPIVPRELVGRVRRILWNMDGQSAKMLDLYAARTEFDNSWQGDLHRLYHELLPESARKQLQGCKTLVVVPQHILHYFPFAALVTEPDSKAVKTRVPVPRFLLDESFDLVYAPSLLSWRRLPAASARQVWAVGVAEVPGAPALKGVKRDLANLQAVFGPSIKGVIDGENARVSAVKKLLNLRGLLFFGAHGLNLADKPLESHLMLLPDEADAVKNGGEKNDGHLTAAQLFASKINADIVIMSACYSGLGDRSPLPGDDLFGLQRAFLQSGVRTVVSGLWDVNDGSAPDLMHGTFKEMAAGKTVVAALASSQRAFLQKARVSKGSDVWLHPYFWAVYTAAGDDRTRFEK